ncbi:hypothetical protein LINGRAHAP2_LOCUS34891 [Linum grandiflorum]
MSCKSRGLWVFVGYKFTLN